MKSYFDRFDICEAYYLYASHYHQGQGSKEYKIFARLNKIGFKMKPNQVLSENGQAIYDNLVKNRENS